MSLVEEFKNDLVALALLRDWLGEGGIPVSRNVAEARAAICLGCPKHEPARFWETALKKPVARAVRRTIELRNKLSLSLSCQKKLGLCSVCRCVLELKAWTPIERIAEHVPPSKMSEFPQNACWIRSEIEAMKGTP